VNGHFRLTLDPGAPAEELARADDEAIASSVADEALPCGRALPAAVEKSISLELAELELTASASL